MKSQAINPAFHASPSRAIHLQLLGLILKYNKHKAIVNLKFFITYIKKFNKHDKKNSFSRT